MSNIYKPQTNQELKKEVKKYLRGISTHPNINSWDTSLITDMSHLFEEASDFNEPLNNWDTSNVTDMSNMFSKATSFNHPLNKWVTSKVTNMREMFALSGFNNKSIRNWNISNVKDMRDMFDTDSEFKQHDSLIHWYDIQHATPRNPIIVAKGYIDLFPDDHDFSSTLEDAVDTGKIREFSSIASSTPSSTPSSTTQEISSSQIFDATLETELDKSNIRVTRNHKAFDFVSFKDVHIIRTINTNRDALIFYQNSKYYLVSKKAILEMINNPDVDTNTSVKYGCITAGIEPTDENGNDNENVDLDTPYFPAKAIGLYGLYLLSQLKYVLLHPDISIIEVSSTPMKKVESVVGIDFYANNGYSSSHCQEGISENVYELKHIKNIQKRVTMKRNASKKPTINTKFNKTHRRRSRSSPK